MFTLMCSVNLCVVSLIFPLTDFLVGYKTFLYQLQNTEIGLHSTAHHQRFKALRPSQ